MISMLIKYFKDFVYTSIFLDISLIRSDLLSSYEKIEFLIKKYLILIIHQVFFRYKIAKSYVNVLGINFYYDSKFGLAGLQATLVRHKRELDFLKDKDIKVIFDIGANVGTFTILCSRLFNDYSIHSFEPIPITFKCLKKNTARLKNVFINNYAVTEKEGVLNMIFNEDKSSRSFISELSNGVEVKTTSLKNYMSKNSIKKIDLLKIDVETFEHLVLEGLGERLKNVRYIMIEVSVKDNLNYTISSLFSRLFGNDYDFQLVSFRNSEDASFGSVDWFDCILENKKYKI